MRKKKLIRVLATVIISVSIIVIAGFSFNYYKYNQFINDTKSLISEEKYDEALVQLSNAEDLKSSEVTDNLKLKIKLDKEQSNKYNEALKLVKEEKYGEAISLLEKIDANSSEIKEKSIKEIAFIKEQEEAKKKELVDTYVAKATDAINNNELDNAEQLINKLKSVDNKNSNIKTLSSKLVEKGKSQKYYNCKYKGISDNQTESVMYFESVPSKPCITRYYNPDLLTEKTFIDFYHSNIEGKLYENYSYVLRSTKDPNYGLLFVCKPNENYEFNMGKIGPDGLLDIYDKSAAYCGIHGDKVVYYNLQTHNLMEPLLKRD